MARVTQLMPMIAMVPRPGPQLLQAQPGSVPGRVPVEALKQFSSFAICSPFTEIQSRTISQFVGRGLGTHSRGQPRRRPASRRHARRV